ncbi:UNVERIFIED_CONTAM: hypothetical protein HDU68_008734 [Siphonaria sp. JEL0065]|nr:hypothetical protein HDU68_008734 [Siphonaria sp. JEL0065]
MALNVTTNEQYNEYVRRTFGPDLFHIIFDGPERASSGMWKHLGNCEYKIAYRLMNPGMFSVQLILAYEKYGALNELVEDWPVTNYTRMIPSNFTLDICASHCPAFTSRSVEEMSLTACSRTEPTQGVYLRISGETDREQRYANEYQHKYVYEPLGCRFDQRFEPHANDTCLNKRDFVVRFAGDSQTRWVATGTNARLRGEGKVGWGIEPSKYFNPSDLAEHPNVAPFVAGGDADLKEDDVRYNLKGVFVDYGDPAFLDYFVDSDWVRNWDQEKQQTRTELELAKFDVVTFATGHWPSSGRYLGGHFGVERYVKLLEYAATYMEEIQRRRPLHGYKPIQFIWLGVNAFTLIEDHNHKYVGYKDWRNNYRIRVWNMFASELFQGYGFPRINNFEITLPWVQDSADQSHLDGLPGLEALVDEVLHKLNICNV